MKTQKNHSLLNFASLAMVGILLFLNSCGEPSNDAPPPPRRFQSLLMGTTFHLTLYDALGETRAQELFQRVQDRVRFIENQTSMWHNQSEISRLSALAGEEPFSLSPESTQVLRRALHYARVSNGAFEPTIAPVVQLWAVATENPRVPEERELEAALALVDYRRIQWTGEQELFLEIPGMGIDLGGIAKGFAADEAALVLEAEGVTGAIVDLGGNLFLVGSKPDGSPWRVGIQDPLSPRGNSLGIVEIGGGYSLVTSGIYERRFEQDGQEYHHIIDPQTGYPADNELAGVSIIAPSSMDADALSTTVFVLGLEAGFSFIQELDDTEAVFVTRDRQVRISPGLQDNFRLINGEYSLMEEANQDISR